MKAAGSLLGDDATDYTERFGYTYPFTPDVISLLHERWGSHSTFQRTRGVLRLLSLVVHSMLKTDRAWIAPGDIDLSVPEIRKELLKHTGDNAESVIIADIVGNNAGAKNEGEEGVRCASCVFMYSFPLTAGGATQAEVKRGVFTYGVPHSVVGDVMNKLRRRLFYLKLTDDDMLRFDVMPNLNHMISQAIRNVPDVDVQQEELDRLQADVHGGRFADVVLWPDATESGSVSDIPVLQLIICKHNDPEWCERAVNGTVRSRRINMNGLVFLLPSDGMALSESLRRYLAVQSIKKRLDMTPDYTTVVRARVESELTRAEQGIGGGLRTKYSAVYIPAKGGKVTMARDYTFNPAEDSGTSLDHLLWNRLVREDQIATSMAPDIARKYGSDADSAYNTMIRTPGVVMPASLEIVRKAFETQSAEDDAPPAGGDSTRGGPMPDYPPAGGDSTRGSPMPDDPTQSEDTYERMIYADVVDSVGLNTVRSLLLEPSKLSLTVFDCHAVLRPDGMYDVRLEMRGEIPDRVVSSIKPTNRGNVETDEGWDE